MIDAKKPKDFLSSEVTIIMSGGESGSGVFFSCSEM